MTRARKHQHMTVGTALLISTGAGLLMLAFMMLAVGAVSGWSLAVTLILNWKEWGFYVVWGVFAAVIVVLRFTLMMVFQERKAGDHDVI